MSTTHFLSRQPLWAEIADRVRTAKTVYAAVAYFAQRGAKLLPLRKGHKLVVDMSIGAVKQGVTDPREIRKLMRKGVQVYSRSTLHSKFIIFDNALLVGSANISENSHDKLDEAAILTTDPEAVRHAKTFFLDHMCVEPVGEEYLKICIKAYRPPIFKAFAEQAGAKRKGRSRAVEAKLWFIGGLSYMEAPQIEKSQIAKAEQRSRGLLKDPKRTEISWLYDEDTPPYFKNIRAESWVVACCIDEDENYEIWPRARVLGIETHKTKSKLVHLLMLEEWIDGEPMTLSLFRRKTKTLIPKLDPDSHGPTPITDSTKADRILKMWTNRGRISKRRMPR